MLSPSMFNPKAIDIAPTPEQIERERQRVQFDKHVKVKRHSVEIYNMHDSSDVQAYEKRMKYLILGIQKGTHQIWENERQLLTIDNKQLWHRYLEWTEFELEERPIIPAGMGGD